MIYFLPLIAAVTGWLTNWIAVKMLFHPIKPLNLGLFTIQGIFPKRQKAMAEKLGKIVATELFSIDDIISKMKSADNAEVLNFVESKLDDFINLKLSTSMPMLAMFLNDDLKSKIKMALLNEIGDVIPGIIDTYANKLKNEVNIETIVFDKVINFSSDKMEEVLYSIMKKEFKFIEVLGGVLGFFIGIIQLLLVFYS